ncbi:Thr operon leader peptide [Flavobacterium chungbukense]
MKSNSTKYTSSMTTPTRVAIAVTIISTTTTTTP